MRSIRRLISSGLINIVDITAWSFWLSIQKKKRLCFWICLTIKVKLFTSRKQRALPKFSFVQDFEFKNAKSFWTSGTDLGEEGKFFFLSNGKDVGQLNWANNEPNNGKKSESNETENCMAFLSTDTLKFYRLFDTFCSTQWSFVCQNIQTNPPQINRYKRNVKNKWMSLKEK